MGNTKQRMEICGFNQLLSLLSSKNPLLFHRFCCWVTSELLCSFFSTFWGDEAIVQYLWAIATTLSMSKTSDPLFLNTFLQARNEFSIRFFLPFYLSVLDNIEIVLVLLIIVILLVRLSLALTPLVKFQLAHLKRCLYLLFVNFSYHLL